MNKDYLQGRKDIKDLKEGAQNAYDTTASYAQGAADKTKEFAQDASKKVSETTSNAWEKTKEKAVETKDYACGAAKETFNK